MKPVIIAIALGLSFSVTAFSDHHEGTDQKMMDKASDKMHGKKGRHGKRMKRLHKRCESDIKTHCSGVEPGEGRIKKCLKEHEGQLSDKCSKAMKKAHDRRAKWKKKKGKMKDKMKDSSDSAMDAAE